MENDKILSDSIISNYVRVTNNYIKYRNRIAHENMDYITIEDVEDALSKTDKQEEIKQASKECWRLYFDSVEDLIHPYLDKITGLRVDE